jgi:hypothetical protein
MKKWVMIAAALAAMAGAAVACEDDVVDNKATTAVKATICAKYYGTFSVQELLFENDVLYRHLKTAGLPAAKAQKKADDFTNSVQEDWGLPTETDCEEIHARLFKGHDPHHDMEAVGKVFKLRPATVYKTTKN